MNKQFAFQSGQFEFSPEMKYELELDEWEYNPPASAQREIFAELEDQFESGLESEIKKGCKQDRCDPAYIRWVQRSLSKILGLGLSETGYPDTKTRSAIRDFQGKRGLKKDSSVGSGTEQALLAAGANQPPSLKTLPCGPTGEQELIKLLNKHRGDIPLHFLLGWIKVESGLRLDSLTSLCERGYFQIHPDESKDRRWNHEPLSYDPDYSIVQGIKLVHEMAKKTEALGKKYGFTKQNDIFWGLVKLHHWIPSAPAKILEAMNRSGVRPLTWQSIEQYIKKRSIPALGKWNPADGVANVNKTLNAASTWQGKLQSGMRLEVDADISGPIPEMEGGFSLLGFPSSIIEALRKGLESVAVKLAVTFGYGDEVTLTNLVFFARHAERSGRPIIKGEPGFDNLSREWLDIRNLLVRPALKQPSAPPPSKPAGAIDKPTGQNGAVNTLMPKSGPGFFCRQPDSRRYGQFETIQALKAIGAAWAKTHPLAPRIVISDISKRGGGKFPPHVSHQTGLDIDIRLMRNDGKEDGTNYRATTYSRALTQELVNLIRANGVLPVEYIFFNDPAVTGVSNQSGHNDHLHVRFCAPGNTRCRPRQQRELNWEDEAFVKGEPAKVDPTDPRIDVSAKFALQRMLKSDPSSHNDASGMITAINTRRLAGIFGDDLRASAQLAQRIGTVRWELIPKGEDAALVLDTSGLPAIVFRGGQGKPPKDGVRRIPSRLDPALRKAWVSFQRLQTGDIQCDGGVRSVGSKFLGRPNALLANVVPACLPTANEPRCGLLPQAFQRASLRKPIRPSREINNGDYEIAAKIEPKLSFFEDLGNDQNAVFFKNQASRWAKVIHSIAVTSSSNCNLEGSTPYKSGRDILEALSSAFICLGAEPIREMHFFGHMYPEGIIGSFNNDGLYFRDPFLSGSQMRPVNRSGGGRTVADLPKGVLSQDVIFILHGCNTATGNDNFARKLWEHLATFLKNPKVFGHNRSVCVGQDGFWREYSRQSPTGTLITKKIPFYDEGGSCGFK
ncbi:MAG: penicillin-insensitive murein endopeptidase [Acidobacteriota bacterium]